MLKRIVISLLVFFIFIFYVMNYTIVPIILGLKPIIHVYNYHSTDLGYYSAEYPGKGNPFENVIEGFKIYQLKNKKNDVTLCREFKRDWIKFWYWHDYLNHKRWDIKYCDEKK
jgi:hypothetical protein